MWIFSNTPRHGREVRRPRSRRCPRAARVGSPRPERERAADVERDASASRARATCASGRNMKIDRRRRPSSSRRSYIVASSPGSCACVSTQPFGGPGRPGRVDDRRHVVAADAARGARRRRAVVDLGAARRQRRRSDRTPSAVGSMTSTCSSAGQSRAHLVDLGELRGVLADHRRAPRSARARSAHSSGEFVW